MDLYKIIETLTESDGVSGDENNICETIAGYFPDEKIIKKDGSVIVFIGEKDANKKTVLIDAHIDRIGMIVTQITENGFLRVGNVGGLDMRILPASRVYVGKNRLPGIVCTKPPHLSDKESKSLEITDILIDVGMDKEQAEKVISPGDRVLLFEKCDKLDGDVITASALDNRAGAAAVILAGKKLIEKKALKYNVVLLFSSCEEVNERGAITAAFDINPEIALVVDTTFAKTFSDKSDITGIMGGGVMIGVSASLDRDLSNALIKTAKENNIPFSLEVMPAKTGTNADVISVNRGGVKSATLSFPIKYMHTQSETVSLSDIEKTVELITAYVGS